MTTTFLGLLIAAMGCEFIDSYLGMMYGTILSPVLIVLGYDPWLVIPSILFSQAVGGFVASFRHHHHKNASFKRGSKDSKVAIVIIGCGIIAVIFGALVGISVPKIWLKTYIGILCIVMGVIVLIGRRFRFSWKKIVGIGVISSFNKALSGGGFGPVVASGLIVSGRDGKKAIGTTDFAEAPICLLAFIAWALMQKALPNLYLLMPLTIGAAVGGYFGPLALSKFKSKRKLLITVGILAFGLGVWTLIKTWLP